MLRSFGVAIVIVAGLVGLAYGLPELATLANQPVYCTQEAKLCPDGSYVGRVRPTCEFARCPGQPQAQAWQIFSELERGISFRYPSELTTSYIFALDWPPQVQVLDLPFTCTEAGSESERAGRTERRLVDSRTYCVTRVTQGAAGSIYTQYAYAFPSGERTVVLTFSLRAVQCSNYDESQRRECEDERATFDLDGVVDRVAVSFRLAP